MRKMFIWVALLGLLVLPVWAEDAARPVMANNVMLVGWDGTHRDHVKALLNDDKLPNLDKLIQQGTLVDVEITSGATDTRAGWSQILTGYKPNVTGVYSNNRFRDVPAGYSIFERLKAQYGKDNVACVAVIGKKTDCGEIDPPFKNPLGATNPKVGHIVEENGVKYVVFNGSPYYTMHKSCDEWHFGLIKNGAVGDKMLEMLDKYSKEPFFFFVHFAEVDQNGHDHGENSKEYDDAIISCDTQLGRLIEQLQKLGVYDKTLIYVTADHGFDLGAKNHRNAPHVFLATNDKQITRGGTRADITPTIFDRLGVDVSKFIPPLDGEPLTKPASKPAAIELNSHASRRGKW